MNQIIIDKNNNNKEFEDTFRELQNIYEEQGKLFFMPRKNYFVLKS
jgi:hypothetical protein